MNNKNDENHDSESHLMLRTYNLQEFLQKFLD
jgi:hypothetical protein